MNLEKELSKIEKEIRDIKNAFEQTARQLPVFTYSVDYSSPNNHMKITYQGGTSYEMDNLPSRTVVTFDTATGSNTLATLEMQIQGEIVQMGMGNYCARRVPYSGGARWIVYNSSTPTNFTFVVHSAVRGTLGVKMIWE